MSGHLVNAFKSGRSKDKKDWSIVLNLGIDPKTLKRKQSWVSFHGSQREAEKKLTELLHQVDTGNFVSTGKTTLGEFLANWLRDYKDTLSPRSFDRYSDIVNKHLIPDLGHIKLSQLKPEHIKHYYTTQGERPSRMRKGEKLSPTTIRYYHAVLHRALDTACEYHILTHNPADAAKPPKKQPRPMDTWDEFEMNQFLRAAKDSPYYELIYMALFTGMRRSEVLGLRWQDINFILSQISVNQGLHQLANGTYIFKEPKSKSSRRLIKMSPTTYTLLNSLKDRQGDKRELVFCHPDGRPLRPNTITNAWRILCKRAGVKVIPLKNARHTHATLMLEQNIHPKIVQERLGHSSIAITLDIYSHVKPGLQEAAAARFDELLDKNNSEKSSSKVVADLEGHT